MLKGRAGPRLESSVRVVLAAHSAAFEVSGFSTSTCLPACAEKKANRSQGNTVEGLLLHLENQKPKAEPARNRGRGHETGWRVLLLLHPERRLGVLEVQAVDQRDVDRLHHARGEDAGVVACGRGERAYAAPPRLAPHTRTLWSVCPTHSLTVCARVVFRRG